MQNSRSLKAIDNGTCMIDHVWFPNH